MTQFTEEEFLSACKVGDVDKVEEAVNNGVDVNIVDGWGLRRAVRYNQKQVWQKLLKIKNLKVNLTNQYGLSALHTACRFNVLAAVKDLLSHIDIQVNEKTMLGSSPLMVAAKYSNWEVVQFLLSDVRVDVATLDNMGRTIDQVIGVARTGTSKDIVKILDMIKAHPKKEVVSLETIEEQEAEEESDCSLQTNILEGINELTKRMEDENTAVTVSNEWIRRVSVTQLLDTQEKQMHQFEINQKMEFEKMESERRNKLRVFQEEQELALKNYVANQEKEMRSFCECQDMELAAFSKRQIADLADLREKQRQETIIVRNELEARTNNSCHLKSHLQNAIDHLQSKLIHLQQTEQETHQDNSLLDSARKDLECPVCLEVMAPPVRIWQCETGHVICETCKDRVQDLMGAVYAKYCHNCQNFHSDKKSSEHKCNGVESPLGWKSHADDIFSGLTSGMGSSISSGDSITGVNGYDTFINGRKGSHYSRRSSLSSDTSSLSGLVSPSNHDSQSSRRLSLQHNALYQGRDSPNSHRSPSSQTNATNPGLETENNQRLPNHHNQESTSNQRLPNHHGQEIPNNHRLPNYQSPNNSATQSPTYGVSRNQGSDQTKYHRPESPNLLCNPGLASLCSWEGLPETLREGLHETLQEGTAICPTCKTAPFTGRNFALERISRTLFCVK